MIILTLRTDKPQSEIGIYQDDKKLQYETWEAHRKLAETIHLKIAKISQFEGKNLDSVEGIVVFKGPGSFTGLRIGISVANALAYSLEVPIVSETEENWAKEGIKRLLDGKSEKTAMPEYGGEVYTTKPKK